MTSREGRLRIPHPVCRRAGAPAHRSRRALRRRSRSGLAAAPRARVPLVERRALLQALDGTAAPLVVALRPGRHRQDRPSCASGRRPTPGRSPGCSSTRPTATRSSCSPTCRWRSRRSPRSTRACTASLSLAVPPVRERILPLLAEALAAAPPLRARARRRPPAQGRQAVGHRRVRAARPAAGRAARDRVAHRPAAASWRGMRAAGEVTEFRAAELALDRGRGRGAAAPARLRGRRRRRSTPLVAATEGWATGLQLACLARAGRPAGGVAARDAAATVARSPRTSRSEVLDAQPPDVQEFLLRTSVLHRAHARVCARS